MELLLPGGLTAESGSGPWSGHALIFGLGGKTTELDWREIKELRDALTAWLQRTGREGE